MIFGQVSVTQQVLINKTIFMKNLQNYGVQELDAREIRKIFGGGAWATLLGNVVGIVLMTFPPTAVVIMGYNVYNEYNN